MPQIVVRSTRFYRQGFKVVAAVSRRCTSSEAQALVPDPVEALSHYRGLFLVDLVTRRATASSRDRAVPLRRPASTFHRALPGFVAFAPAAAPEHLGALVLGDHACIGSRSSSSGDGPSGRLQHTTPRPRAETRRPASPDRRTCAPADPAGTHTPARLRPRRPHPATAPVPGDRRRAAVARIDKLVLGPSTRRRRRCARGARPLTVDGLGLRLLLDETRAYRPPRRLMSGTSRQQKPPRAAWPPPGRGGRDRGRAKPQRHDWA